MQHQESKKIQQTKIKSHIKQTKQIKHKLSRSIGIKELGKQDHQGGSHPLH